MRTVFVRALPSSTTDEVRRAAAKAPLPQAHRLPDAPVFFRTPWSQTLAEMFGESGPVKRAFLVRDGEGQSRNFGFVQL